MTKLHAMFAMIGLALVTTLAAVAPAHAAYKFERASATSYKWANGVRQALQLAQLVRMEPADRHQREAVS